MGRDFFVIYKFIKLKIFRALKNKNQEVYISDTYIYQCKRKVNFLIYEGKYGSLWYNIKNVFMVL
ncbi:hypothetical protein ANASTE_00993 [Anaerofustis stercorihominis DSM 17244]|uniref:Uncharacterized protein n=1 Tax=Anaerofustis stercorihominis DSM 17244 TaxID=445971 RepID=B1C8D6_9FIRM|nr:hypothetical protein ANASTE_00993 [Anaerofustis stercorihominis DSM 17244]